MYQEHKFSISEAADFLVVSQFELLLMWKWNQIPMYFDEKYVPYFKPSDLTRIRLEIMRGLR